ncbi:MAG: DUF1499 domain-containing protein [Desulfobacterales bacterium]|nr:DUF1499 domain-containing protein [Desulfobacterales bacterium]
MALSRNPTDRLLPCPDRPNCISSLSRDPDQYEPPLQYTSVLQKARIRLLTVLNSFERVRIVATENDYIHAEFRSSFFRFVDDLELLFDEQRKVIHFRSASRMGYYDFGVNRRRIESIRKKFE